MCCLFFASCSKDIEVVTPEFSKDDQLETLIKKDFTELNVSIQSFFRQLGRKRLLIMKNQLNSGATLADLDSRFSSSHFQSIQLRLADNFKLLSYYEDQVRLDDFVDEMARSVTRGTSHLAKAYGTPCFDAWDLAMASIAAGAAICLSYSPPTLVAISKCSAGAAIAMITAEISYRNCMEQYE